MQGANELATVGLIVTWPEVVGSPALGVQKVEEMVVVQEVEEMVAVQVVEEKAAVQDMEGTVGVEEEEMAKVEIVTMQDLEC